MSSELVARQIELWSDGRPQPQDMTLFDQSLGSALSKDGQSVLLSDQGSVAGTTYATYLRRADQPEPVRLGDGQAVDLSPDGQSALSIVYGPPSRLLLLPVGAGTVTELPNPQKLTVQAASPALRRSPRRVSRRRGWRDPARIRPGHATGAIAPFTETGVSPMSYSGTAGLARRLAACDARRPRRATLSRTRSTAALASRCAASPTASA